MGQTGRRSIATHILAVKIVSAVAIFHGFGVALAGPWNTIEKWLSARSALQESPKTRPKHYQNGVFSP
jgi:hypothetical protein